MKKLVFDEEVTKRALLEAMRFGRCCTVDYELKEPKYVDELAKRVKDSMKGNPGIPQ